jgi:signal transduction histidine kinase/DNA-binding response OmpR family regulator
MNSEAPNPRLGWLGWPWRALPRWVARIPAPIHLKLFVAFLAIVLLLVTLGLAAIQALGSANERAEDLGAIERKVSAYHQLQTQITVQFNAGSSAFTADGNEATLAGIRRALNNSDYLFARLEFVAPEERAILDQIAQDHEQFVAAMLEVVNLVEAGRVFEALALQRETAEPLASNLRRLTDDLVNRAQSTGSSTIDENHDEYVESRTFVFAVVVASVVLALILGYAIAWSLIRPVQRMGHHLKHVASGDFSQHVEVENRDELGVLAANLNQMTDDLGRAYRDLETASRHKSEFLANMSHELRTPLNAVIGFSEVLQERMFGELNEKQAEYVDDILTSGKHLLSLINDILDLSKIEAGRMELEVSSFALSEALENGLSMLRERASRGGVTLELDVDPQIGAIEADERKVKQVIFNLLSNAVKFTPDGGRVGVTARRLPGAVEVAVWDTGIGIEQEDLSRIFEEFQQAGRRPGIEQEGTGLGLALTRRLVEMHGGAIRVESRPGKGSSFTFTLAAGAATALREQGHGSAPLAATPEGPVLIVEDDPRAAELLRIYLAGAGFQPLICPTGEDGLKAARTQQPVAVVLDILLPDLKGWDVLERLKAEPATADVPVVMVSMLDDRGKGFALGADDYLVKPVEREHLLATLGRVIARRNGQRSDGPLKVLAVDDDPIAIELVRALLEPQGFAVLAAVEGEQGIAIALSEDPALIICDLMMPGMDGFAVVDALRANPATAATPIVILTSKAVSREERERLNSHISYLAQKTEFNRAEFTKLVRNLSKSAGGTNVG